MEFRDVQAETGRVRAISIPLISMLPSVRYNATLLINNIALVPSPPNYIG